MELCHDDSSVTISKDHHLLDICARRNFLGRGEDGLLHSFDCDFNSGSKSLTHASSIATISVGGLPRKVSILMYDL